MSLISRKKRATGWGPPWRFPVERADGPRLVLTFRVPVDWKAIDVLKLPSEAATTSGSLAQAMALLAREMDASGAVGVVGIGRAVEREGKPDLNLFATVTIAMAEVDGPFPESTPEAEVEPVEVARADGPYRGVRVRRAREVKTAPDRLGPTFFTFQYLSRTEYGALATTFATPQAAFGQLLPLLDTMAAGVVIEPVG